MKFGCSRLNGEQMGNMSTRIRLKFEIQAIYIYFAGLIEERTHVHSIDTKSNNYQGYASVFR